MEQTESQAPIIASIDDIDREFAEDSFRNTSFSPEKRGESRRKDYADTVNGLYAELWRLATSEAQLALLATEMEAYRQGYLKRMNAYLASHSNVASTMITGAANFPGSLSQKRSQWADNRLKELYEWDEKARNSIKRKILDLRPEDVKQAELGAEAWKSAEESITLRLGILDQIDNGSGKYNTRPYYEDIIVYSVRKLAKDGNVRLTDRALVLVKAYEESHTLPAFPPKHAFWKLGDLASKNAAKEQEEADRLANAVLEEVAQAEGVKIIANPAADRVQILFDTKPSPDMIAKLKGEAWKWSPNNGAWQRKLTEAAKASAKRLICAA